MHRRPTVRRDEVLRHVREGPADAVPREDGSLARLVLERPKQADESGPRRRRLETVGVEVRHVVPESRLHFPGVGAAPDLAAHGEWVERPGLIRGRAQGRRQLRDPSPRRVLFNRRARHEDDVGGRLLSVEADWQGRRQVFLTRGRILVRNPGDRLEFVQDGLELRPLRSRPRANHLDGDGPHGRWRREVVDREARDQARHDDDGHDRDDQYGQSPRRTIAADSSTRCSTLR